MIDTLLRAHLLLAKPLHHQPKQMFQESSQPSALMVLVYRLRWLTHLEAGDGLQPLLDWMIDNPQAAVGSLARFGFHQSLRSDQGLTLSYRRMMLAPSYPSGVREYN